MKINDKRAGFKVLKIDDLSEYNSKGIHLIHEKTGCEVYHISNSDEENLFSFNFPTPPADHTGVPHILEHTVLCGSEKYPIKDPFLSMLKGSMYTFLNAMTYPDKTVYPAGSVVEKDYFNLLSVYGDAVFFPQLKEEAFRQEGHRLELTEEGELQRVGIVYNEMKGAYSSEDSIAADWSIRSLFEDHPYAWESGGDPRFIPDLTYEQFKEFHRQYYHPSNCKISLYGNIPTGKILDFLENEFLNRFERLNINAEIPRQKIWDSPRKIEKPWPCSAEEGTENKTTLALNWLLMPITENTEVIAFTVLTEILMGHAGSPLEKALVTSGLGEDISPVSGIEADLNNLIFSVGLRGSDPEKETDFQNLVFSVLRDLAENGIPRDVIESALRQIEFRTREIRSGQPFGLRLFKRMLRGWLNGGDPKTTMVVEESLIEVRKSAEQPGYFEGLIKKYLLDNNHYSQMSIIPDPEMQTREAQREKDEMKKILASLTEKQKEEIRQKEQELRIFQETPDSEEQLAKIPFLTRDDIPKKIITIPLNKEQKDQTLWYTQEIFTNGIVYLNLILPVSNLSEEEFKTLPLFCRTLTGLGLTDTSYDELTHQISLKTGGLGATIDAGTSLDNGLQENIYIRIKMLKEQVGEAVDLLKDILTKPDYSNTSRLKEMVMELKNDYKSGVIPSGTHFASLRSGSHFSKALAAEEAWHGISQLEFLNDLCQRKEFPSSEIIENLKSLRKKLFSRSNMRIQLTYEEGDKEKLIPVIGQLLENLPEKVQESDKVTWKPYNHPTRGESLYIPAQVGYIAATLPGARFGTPRHSHQILLAHLLRTGYLWERIRMKGGAYGASAVNSGIEETFTLSSYRDPNIHKTLEAFKEGFNYLAETLCERDLLLALIGVIGKELRPMVPADKGMVALKRDLFGMTDERRQKKRDLLLKITVEELKEAAMELAEQWEERIITILSGKDVVAKAAESSPEIIEAEKELPL